MNWVVFRRASLAITLALSLTILLTTSAGATLLLRLLEVQSSVLLPQITDQGAQAIAVLSGRPERGKTAAELHLETGLPLALIGADEFPGYPPWTMQEVVRNWYGVEPTWVEGRSHDTRENAQAARCILLPLGIRRIVLVTDTYHMRRAGGHFQAAGFEVIAAPSSDPRLPHGALTWADLVPSGGGVHLGQLALKEWLGVVLAPVERLVEPASTCGRWVH